VNSKWSNVQSSLCPRLLLADARSRDLGFGSSDVEVSSFANCRKRSAGTCLCHRFGRGSRSLNTNINFILVLLDWLLRVISLFRYLIAVRVHSFQIST
jgi:hypothetical protein